MLWSKEGAGAAPGRWKKGAFLCPARFALHPGNPRFIQELAMKQFPGKPNNSPFFCSLPTLALNARAPDAAPGAPGAPPRTPALSGVLWGIPRAPGELKGQQLCPGSEHPFPSLPRRFPSASPAAPGINRRLWAPLRFCPGSRSLLDPHSGGSELRELCPARERFVSPRHPRLFRVARSRKRRLLERGACRCCPGSEMLLEEKSRRCWKTLPEPAASSGACQGHTEPLCCLKSA